MTQIIYSETGQSVKHTPPARVDSATYAIEDLTRDNEAADRVLGSGAATVPTWTITSTADAGRGERNAARISAAATTGPAIGAKAMIEGGDGGREIFEVTKISADAYIEADADLAAGYLSGATVRGVELSASFPDATAADEDFFTQRRPLRVVWTYTIDGRRFVVKDDVELVRHTAAITAPVGQAITQLRTLYPDLPARLAEGGNLERMVIVLADEVAEDLRRKGIRPEAMLATKRGLSLIRARMLAHAAHHGYAPGATEPGETWRRETHATYRGLLEDLTIGEPGEGVTEEDPIADHATQTPSRELRGPTLRM